MACTLHTFFHGVARAYRCCAHFAATLVHDGCSIQHMLTDVQFSMYSYQDPDKDHHCLKATSNIVTRW
eukprot:5455642-Amphidinium_carterae.1